MTGYTFAEKVLAKAAGVEVARAGDVLDVRADVMFSHDNTAAIRRIFESIGAPRILHPERAVITLDHAVPAPTTQHARITPKSASGCASRGLSISSRSGAASAIRSSAKKRWCCRPDDLRLGQPHDPFRLARRVRHGRRAH